MNKSAILNEAPWLGLGEEVARALAPAIPPLVDEVIQAVGQAVPDYEGVLDSNVRAGVQQALEGFLELVDASEGRQVPGREVYVRFGRGERRAGRSLDALLHAYRVGAQVAWRGVARAGDAAGLPPRALYGLAEAIFAYIDELSAASADGYAYEQSVAARAEQELRTRLVESLLREPPAPPDEVADLAGAAGWELPATLGVLVFEPAEPDRVGPRLPTDALAARIDGLGCALVPDAEGPGRAAELRRAVRSARAALGPPVAWSDARESARRARLALGLIPSDDPGGLVLADDHLLDLLVLGDRAIAEDLAQRRLRPLEDLTPAARERTIDTLRAWLDAQGEARPAAERLHVHVQTVRYRIARARQLFGDALDDPQARLELALALRIAERRGPAAEHQVTPSSAASRSPH